jgi:HlyD family secretion protein
VIAQDLSQMQVDTSIDESEVGRIRMGQEATFTVDSFPGRTFRGTVAQIRKAAQVVQNVVTYIAVIRTSNADLGLFPGMTANVRVIVDTRENVLKVPNAALRFRPAGAAADAPAAPGAASEASGGEQKGKGKGKGQALVERLTKELGLTPEQRSRIEAIMTDTRARIGDVSAEDQSARRREMEKLRAESRARIAEVLNAEQRVKYEGMAGGGRSRAGGVTGGRVWLVGEDGKPKAVPVRLGLTDGTSTEVVSGEVQEGTEVITGVSGDTGKARGTPSPAKGPRFGY